MSDNNHKKKIKVTGKIAAFLLANFPTTMHFMFLVMVWTFDVTGDEIWFAYKLFLGGAAPLSFGAIFFVIILLRPLNHYLQLYNEGEENIDREIMETAWKRATDLPGMLVFATGGGVFLMGGLLIPIFIKLDYLNIVEMFYVGLICTLGSMVLSAFMYFIPRRLLQPAVESIAARLDISWTAWKYTIAVRSLITGFVISLAPGLLIGTIGMRQATFSVQDDIREKSFHELKVIKEHLDFLLEDETNMEDLKSVIEDYSGKGTDIFLTDSSGKIILSGKTKPSDKGLKGINEGESEGIWRSRASHEYIPYMEVGKKGMKVGIAGKFDKLPDGFLNSRKRMLIVAGLTFILTISATLLFAFSISRPLTRLTAKVKEAEKSKGTLLDKVVIITEDEVGDLVDAFNRMVELNRKEMSRREEMGREITSAVEKLYAFSAEVLKSSEKQSAGAGEQASSVQEATTASLEIATTSKQINERALSVRDLSEQSWEACKEGQDDVDLTIDGVINMGRLLDDTAITLDKLKSKSQAIERVLALIRDVSEKTNLLSLNAALEASAAGETGKRFAVVADQVRRLADRSREAVEEVSLSLVEISTLIEGSAQIGEQGREVAREGLALTEKLKTAFSHINDTIKSFHNVASEISLSTKQQTTASEQMVEVLGQVAELARSVAGDSRDIQNSISQLKSLSDNLHKMVGEESLTEIKGEEAEA